MKTAKDFFEDLTNSEHLIQHFETLKDTVTDDTTSADIAAKAADVAAKLGYSVQEQEILDFCESKLIGILPGDGTLTNAAQPDAAAEEISAEGPEQDDQASPSPTMSSAAGEKLAKAARASANFNFSRWMAKVPDDRLVKDMSIPGTHDSATWKMITGATKCQQYDIQTQLNHGIRYLDIRVGYNGQLYHGDFICSVTLYEVIKTCSSFLRENKSEMIMVLLSMEGVRYPTAAFQSWLKSSFDDFSQYWSFQSSIDTLGKVRGKMVLINGDDTGKPGLSYYDSFVRQNDWNPGTMWNTWKERAVMKIMLILEFLKKSYDTPSSADYNKLRVNNWNKQFNFGVSIKTYADTINEAFKTFPKIGHGNVTVSFAPHYPRGIQVMDFYRIDVVSKIIASNIGR